MVLVGDDDGVVEAKLRLGRIGYDTVAGALTDHVRVFLEHPEVVERGSKVTAVDLRERLAGGAETQLVDVRNPGEVKLGSLEEGKKRRE